MAAFDLLLHICCGPCAIWPIRKFKESGYKIGGYFFNPNIQPLAEYLARRAGVGECALRLNAEILYDDEWNIHAWLQEQAAHAMGAERCERCIAQRLRKTAAKARELHIDFYSTSLLYSRYQPHDYIKKTGEEIGEEEGVEFVYRDFREFWQAGIDESKAWGLYRQKYCGCIYSEAERYIKKLKNLQKNMK